MDELLLSIKPRFAEMIVRGDKRVELRRRFMRVDPVFRVWIYSTLPVGQIVATAVVTQVRRDRPDLIWQEVNGAAGLSFEEFKSYTAGSKEVCALFISQLRILPHSPTLEQIRTKTQQGFMPPQSARRIGSNVKLISLLKSSLKTNGLNR